MIFPPSDHFLRLVFVPYLESKNNYSSHTVLLYLGFFRFMALSFVIYCWWCREPKKTAESWVGWCSDEVLCGSLPKLTRSWAITPSAVCDLWLMAFGQRPAPYLPACLTDNGQALMNSPCHLSKYIQREAADTCRACMSDKAFSYISAAEWSNGQSEHTTWVHAHRQPMILARPGVSKKYTEGIIHRAQCSYWKMNYRV